MSTTNEFRVPYWITYVATVAVLFALSLLIPSDLSVPMSSSVVDKAKTMIDLMSEMVKLITALNTALMGGAAAMTVKGKDWSAQWQRFDGYLVLAVFVCVAVSYYGIYLGYFAIMGMVEKGAVYFGELRLQWALSLQYYGTLLGVFLLGLSFIRLLEGRLVVPE